MAYMSVMFQGRNGVGNCNTDVLFGSFAKVVRVQEVFSSVANGTVSIGNAGASFDLDYSVEAGNVRQTSSSDLSDHLYLAIVEIA